MPITITKDITKNSISQSLNVIDPIQEYNFVLQNNSSVMELDDFDLNSLPELKLTRKNAGYYGRCKDTQHDFEF